MRQIFSAEAPGDSVQGKTKVYYFFENSDYYVLTLIVSKIMFLSHVILKT